MCTEATNSLELAEDEQEQEYLRRQEELHATEEVEKESTDATKDSTCHAFDSFANDSDDQRKKLDCLFTTRVLTKRSQLETVLKNLSDHAGCKGSAWLPEYASSRVIKSVVLTHINYGDQEKDDIGQTLADRLSCPVVSLGWFNTEHGFDFSLDKDTISDLIRLGWRFVILPSNSMPYVEDPSPWKWCVNLRNQLVKAGAEDVYALPLGSLDPTRMHVPNSFVMCRTPIHKIMGEELYYGETLWQQSRGDHWNCGDGFDSHAKSGPIPIDLTPVTWQAFKFIRQEALVIRSRRFPGKHSEGVPRITAEHPLIRPYDVPSTVILKALAVSHGSRKTQSIKDDFDQRVIQQGGCCITITPLRSVNSSIHQLFGGQQRNQLMNNRTLQTEENLTSQFLTGTDKQRHCIICVESLTHKSAIGLKVSELRHAWQELKNTTGSAPTIDVVIDEIPIVVDRMLDGGTVKNPGLTMDVFTELLQFCVMTGGRVSMMSADLSVKEHALIGGILKLTDADWNNPSIVSCINGGIRTGLSNKRSISLSTNVEACKERLFIAINEAKENKQCVFLASNKVKPSSTSTGTLSELIKIHCGEDTRVLELNSRTVVNTKHAAHSFINLPEHNQMLLLKDVDVVVATSVVEAGVSWDSRLFDDVPDSLIHSIFCIDVDGRWSASGKLQAINRWRNPAVPAEICTTEKRMCDKGYVFEGDFARSKIVNTLIKDRDAFTMMIMGIFGSRQLEHDNWVDALAHKIQQEQLQLANPLAAVSAVAKAMGHLVNLIDDSGFGVQKKIAAQTLAKLITRRHRSVRAAVTARAITIEGAERVTSSATDLIFERTWVKAQAERQAGGNGLNAVAAGISELKDRNYRLAQKGKQPTTAAGLQAKQDRIDNYEFLGDSHRLTLQALQMVEAADFDRDQLGKHQTRSLDAFAALQLATRFFDAVETTVETLIPVLDRDALKKLSKNQNKTDEVQMLLERLAVMDEFCLDQALTAEGVEMPAHEWMELTYSQIPQLLHKRFIIEADDKTIEKINHVALFEVPLDTTTGRVIEVARAVRAAAQGSATGLFDKFTAFEHTFGTSVDEGFEAFVRSALVKSDWLTQADLLEINSSWTKCCKWIAGNFDRIEANSYGHSFMTSDCKEVKQLAEMIHSNRSAYAPVISNAKGCIERANKASNHFHYLKKIFEEVSIYSLTTLGDIPVKGKTKKLAVLIRKQDLPSDAECQRLYQRWLDTMLSSAESLDTYMTFERESLLSDAPDSISLKQMIKRLSKKSQESLRGFNTEQLYKKLVITPEHKKRPFNARKFNILSFRRARRRLIT